MFKKLFKIFRIKTTARILLLSKRSVKKLGNSNFLYLRNYLFKGE